jgi:hypothetical protein
MRRIRPLLGALWVGTVVTAGTVATTSVLVACDNEQAPETHVKRLSDPIKRAQAVTRLVQFYEDAMTNDKKNREGPHVKPLLDVIVPPLTELAVKGELDEKTQGELVAMLSDTRDKRAVPALVKAIDDYRPDDKRGEKFDADIANVVLNLGETKEMAASDALLKLFTSLRASWPKAQHKGFYRILRDTMLKIGDPKWEPQLVKMLDVPIKTLKQKELKQITDQVYWQTVAIELLGQMQAKTAVVPLIKVVLSPFKVNLQVTAISALIKIGKPAIDEGVKLLNGESAALQTYAEEEYIRATKDNDRKVDKKVEEVAKDVYKMSATIIVSNIGRPECVDPLLTAMGKGDNETRSVIARELSKLPINDKVTAAFKTAWEKTGLTEPIPPAGNAKEALTGAVGGFFDRSLSVWVAEQAIGLKGEEADVNPVVSVALEGIMKIGGKSEFAMLDKLAEVKINYPEKSTIGKAYEKEIATSKQMVEKCGDDLDCWAKLLVSPEAQDSQGYGGIKAAYMIAAAGGDAARAKLVESIPRLINPAVRFVAISAIDRLAPNGDKATADKLQDIVDKAYATRDDEKINEVKSLNTVIYRLRARAQ